MDWLYRIGLSQYDFLDNSGPIKTKWDASLSWDDSSGGIQSSNVCVDFVQPRHDEFIGFSNPYDAPGIPMIRYPMIRYDFMKFSFVIF